MATTDKKQSASHKRRPAASAGKSGTAVKSRPAPKRSSSVRIRKRPQPERRTKSRPAPNVVYTQPEPFHRGRFLLRLATVVAVVLALFFGMSVFFKVKTIVVSGTNRYTAWDVRVASGIEEGENLLALNEAMIGGKIKTALPYVYKSRVGIKLPDTVNIEIVEIAVTYAVEAKEGGWWLMAADGQLMETVNSADAEDYTKILGVKLNAPVAGEQAVAAEPEPEQSTGATDESGQTETTEAVVQESVKLAAALDIAQYLEENGILGTVRSIDVNDMGQIELWYGEQYHIFLGDSTRLSYKIEMLKNTMDQLGEHYSGNLDLSYTIRPNEVIYTPFS